MTAKPARRSRWTVVPLLAGCLAVSLAAVLYPIYVVRPFRAQGVRELAAALVVLRFQPAITLLSAIAAVVAVVWYWRTQPRWMLRILAGLGAALVALLAVAARINVYELMFHPAGSPAFAAAADTSLDGDEKVIVVHLGSEARAYPVRSISYHHVINDVLDGKAIVATY